MLLRDYKEFLLNHPVLKRMNEQDYNFFSNGIKNNKPFFNMNYYIDKYKMTNDEFNIINKYTIAVNNLFTDDEEIK